MASRFIPTNPYALAGTTLSRPTIRSATRDDADAVTALARRAKGSWGYPASWLEHWHAELTVSAAYILAQRVFVTLAEGEIIGCCALEDHDEYWMLEHVWIEPAWQRQGIGRGLVEYALAVVSTIRPGLVRLSADPFAVPFYHQLGALTVGTTPAPMPGAPDRALTSMVFHVPGVSTGLTPESMVVPSN